VDITKQDQEQQVAKRQQCKISSFIGNFQIGILLNKIDIRKLRGASPQGAHAVPPPPFFTVEMLKWHTLGNMSKAYIHFEWNELQLFILYFRIVG
jgi:hypothetical protein